MDVLCLVVGEERVVRGLAHDRGDGYGQAADVRAGRVWPTGLRRADQSPGTCTSRGAQGRRNAFPQCLPCNLGRGDNVPDVDKPFGEEGISYLGGLEYDQAQLWRMRECG